MFTSDGKKLTEKAFLQGISVSVVSILICIIALCSVTWAWFSEGVSSSENRIKSGYCIVEVSVTSEGAEIAPKEAAPYTYTLEAGRLYQIKIISEGTVRSSYCKLLIGGKEYYTEQISTAEPYNTISFTLQFGTETDIEIITRWGTYRTPNEQRDFYNGHTYLDVGKEQEVI